MFVSLEIFNKFVNYNHTNEKSNIIRTNKITYLKNVHIHLFTTGLYLKTFGKYKITNCLVNVKNMYLVDYI